MDEVAWQTTIGRPLDMFRHIRNRLSARKAQLIACAACRLIWEHLEDPGQRLVVETVELFADGQVPDDAYEAAKQTVLRQVTAEIAAIQSTGPQRFQPPPTPQSAAILAVQAIVGTPYDDGLRRTLDWVSACGQRAALQGTRGQARDRMQRQFCELFREIVGNPFRERTVVPAWMPTEAVEYPAWLTKVSDTARCIAEGVRIDQAFDRLPILADALEEAGCMDEDLLTHFRLPDVRHVRGCWALDLVLGVA